MRLAMLSSGLPTAQHRRGGIERVAHMLAEGLAARGHAVVVFSHDDKPSSAKYNVRSLPWKSFVNTWAGRRMTYGYLGNVLAVLPDLREFDAVIAHGDSLLLPLIRKPVVRVMHGSALGEALHATRPGRFLLQAGVYFQELVTAAVATRGVVAVSENARRSNPFIRHVIPLAADPAIFQPHPREKTAHPSILFVGAMHGRKRGRFLIDTFSRVIRPVFSDAELIFVGPAGPAIAGVSYHTSISDETLSSLYRRAWVYASPSTYEGFGLPYLEAMACGTSVLASPNPGSNEVLSRGDYGRLAADAEFGAALVELLNNRRERQRLEGAGLDRAHQFSFSLMIDRYESLLLELIDTHA